MQFCTGSYGCNGGNESAGTGVAMKYKVWSRTDSTKWYEVETNHAGGVTHCTCDGYKNRQECWHARGVESNPSSYALLDTGGMSPLVPIANDAKPLPMLAKPWTGRIIPNTYAVEEKFDGHRAVVHCDIYGKITAWSRTGIDCLKKLSPAMLEDLRKLGVDWTLDGEIVRLDGGRSYNVSHLQHKHLTFVVFDILSTLGFDTTGHPYDVRRSYLIELFRAALMHPDDGPVQLVNAFNPADDQELHAVIGAIWDRGGEGVIIKHRKGTYRPGKRTDAFAKVKQCERAVLTLKGFVPSTGEIKFRGLAATAVLQDAEGNYTVVKTGSDENCERFAAGFNGEPKMERARISSRWVDYDAANTYVGRKVMIEYHERTADGSYRSPRWDRFEDE